ncbi:vanadium-dependent haloperoxidase [Rubellimicrobium roseum]|uniref:Vanadium-dependent haloperoxidase n=2 Tax=Rubellimicrobium roseum TaxID=687525 RepID=A0A5C4N8D6_9RHOB|nr:vanadium-dependent haloperoxidase [Rubellimicrobium roseum]
MVAATLFLGSLQAVEARPSAEEVLQLNTRLALELARHTPTYSPPVASRTFAYLYVVAHEATAGGSGQLRSLAGQLNGLRPVPGRGAGLDYDDGVALQAALGTALAELFANTGPTGQRALDRMADRLGQGVAEDVPPATAARSRAWGEAVARHVLSWAEADGGQTIENMGFPLEFELAKGRGAWVPTSRIVQQQLPLLPDWGSNRPFAMPDGAACPVPAPPAYSEEPASAFRAEAIEVLEVARGLTDEQRAIAQFWSDDPMLSPTPPGHWIAIAQQVLDGEDADVERRAEVMATLAVAMADAFIGCWHDKYRYNLIRPVTFIRAHLNPGFEPLLITPPFPEYPSGHSTQSGAAATVLTAFFGEGYAFTDATHEEDGLPARHFPSFWAAAEEAAISRLYGGIHFRAAIEGGLEQGRCIGAHAVALETRR